MAVTIKMAVFWVVETCRQVEVVWYDWYEDSVIRAMSSLDALMMEAVQTCETLVNSYQSTRRYNPDDRHLHYYII
jgi:hypothetical protein